MARRSREELDEIVRRELPGHHVVTGPGAAGSPVADAAPPPREAPDAGTPDLDTLRRKYLREPGRPGGTTADLRAAEAPAADAGAAPDDDQIVAVAPDEGPDPWDRAVRPKSVVIDPEGRIIGSQG
jgi:hypothetical protein